MHTFLKGKVFRGAQSHLRRDQTFHHRVVGQVQVHHHMVRHAAFLKGTAEELCHVVFNAHGGKYDGEFLIGIFAQGGLLHDLGSQPVMGKTVSGENGQLLSADQSGQTIDGGNTGPDIVSRILSGHGI